MGDRFNAQLRMLSNRKIVEIVFESKLFIWLMFYEIFSKNIVSGESWCMNQNGI